MRSFEERPEGTLEQCESISLTRQPPFGLGWVVKPFITGIPRETVRRKINQLLKLNVIVEKEPARYCLRPGILHEPYRQAAFARGLAETVRFMNELLAHDVVRWVPNPAVSVVPTSVVSQIEQTAAAFRSGNGPAIPPRP